MDTAKLYELARNVENSKANLKFEIDRHAIAQTNLAKAQELAEAHQKALDDFLNEASGE